MPDHVALWIAVVLLSGLAGELAYQWRVARHQLKAEQHDRLMQRLGR